MYDSKFSTKKNTCKKHSVASFVWFFFYFLYVCMMRVVVKSGNIRLEKTMRRYIAKHLQTPPKPEWLKDARNENNYVYILSQHTQHQNPFNIIPSFRLSEGAGMAGWTDRTVRPGNTTFIRSIFSVFGTIKDKKKMVGVKVISSGRTVRVVHPFVCAPSVWQARGCWCANSGSK